MKLHELQFTKDLNATHGDEGRLKDIIYRHGWRFLGSGAEAVVAEHPDRKYVIKLFKPTSRYRDFVKFVEQHPNNPHLPKLGTTIKKIPSVAHYNYIRMEKLKKLDQGELYNDFLPEMIYLAANLIGSNVFHRVFDILKRDGYVIFNKSPQVLDKIYEKYGDPLNTWTAMVDNFVKYTRSISDGISRLDLHASNFMSRDGTLVLIDPYI